MFKDKGIIIGIVVTIFLIAGGIFLMTKNDTVKPSAPVSSDILIPKGDYETSGIVNGNYLPATSSAKLTIVEFGDYQCPACGIYHPFTKQLLTDFAGKINYVFRNFPLSQHGNAQISSQAAEAAGLQGKFWQMNDKLFETQDSWSTLPDPKSTFFTYAQDFGLDAAKFAADLDSQAVKDKVKGDTNDGNLANLTQTPTFFMNGVKIDNLPSNYEGLKSLVTEQLSK